MMHYRLLLMLGMGMLCLSNAHAADDWHALYETQHINLDGDSRRQSLRWELFVSDQYIAKRHPEKGEVEIWTRDEGRIHYSLLFEKEHRVLDYEPGDLRSIGQYYAWKELGSVIDPALLSRMKVVGEQEGFGQKAIHYQGQVGGRDTEIVWLEVAALPMLVRQSAGSQVYQLKLRELAAGPPSWQYRPGKDFQRLDYADLGDNEADPFWARVSGH